MVVRVKEYSVVVVKRRMMKLKRACGSRSRALRAVLDSQSVSGSFLRGNCCGHVVKDFVAIAST